MSASSARHGDIDPATGCFADLHPPLTGNQAQTEADRCLFCYDAPCMTACPTSIDIPLFIREISKGNPKGAAKTILDSNIMGATCARVCPTEVLCEEACVRNHEQDGPVEIGQLQRFATDALFATDEQPFTRAPSTGRKVAVVGGGPAGLSCAHGLARHGHDVTIIEARDKLGGLTEYGIAAYKVTEDITQREVDFVLAIGGITVKTGTALGRDVSLDHLRYEFDAVFLACGLNDTNNLGLSDGGGLAGVYDAVDYIADLRQSDDLAGLPVGRNVVVIGGGMTAIDIAVQSRKLGAEEVTLVYRRGQEQMGASEFEQQLALINGVKIRYWGMPKALHGADGKVTAIDFERTALNGDGKLAGTGETYTLPADMVFAAIGQKLDLDAVMNGSARPDLEWGRFKVSDTRQTSLGNVWAGGDAISDGQDLTVEAVEDGKKAAASIHAYLGGLS